MTDYLLQLNRPEHESNLVTFFAELYLKDTLVDVTLVSSEGILTGAHRLVLSASSLYFQQLFDQIQSKHPVVVLKDVEQEDIQKLLLFMYKGQTKADSLERVEHILSVAKAFKLKGLESLRIENRSNRESHSNLVNQPVLQPTCDSVGFCESALSTNPLTNQITSMQQDVLEGTLPEPGSARSNFQALFQQKASSESKQTLNSESEMALRIGQQPSYVVSEEFCSVPNSSSTPDTSNSALSGMSSLEALQVDKIPGSGAAVPEILSSASRSRLSSVAGSSGFGTSMEIPHPSFIKIENSEIVSNRFEDESNGEFENNEFTDMSGIGESRLGSECHDRNIATTGILSGDILVTEFQMPETEADSDQKKFTCKQCGLKFPDWAFLWRHMKTHDGGNLIKCDYCPRTYSRADSLRKHVSMSHGKLSRPRGRKRGYGKLS